MATVRSIKRVTARAGRRGDTLVEVMIAMVLFLFIFIAVLQSSLLAIDSNTRNMLRNEAVKIAAQSMNTARSMPFDNLLNMAGQGINPVYISRNFRNMPAIRFAVTNTPSSVSQDDDQLIVKVTWNWRGTQYTHQIQSVISK